MKRRNGTILGLGLGGLVLGLAACSGEGVDASATGGTDAATGGQSTSVGGAPASGGATPGTGGGAATGGSGGTPPPDGFYQMEDLDRGVVALPREGGIFVSWRLFGYEPSDASFLVYRDGVLLDDAPLTGATNLLDPSGTNASKYTVVRADDGQAATSPAASVWSEGYLEIATPPPPAGDGFTYSSGDGSVGDLDGDGDLELVVKWDPSNAKDNSQSGHTGNVFLDAYDLDGTRLWRLDLGVNIRAGAHYTQFLVYDLDGDGRAEVALKTAPGTKDGTGAHLSLGPAASDDDSEDYRNDGGYILTGPEYLTVFDGATGKELATANFEVGRGTVSGWGDGYGNRVDRFVASIAFVEDTGRPSLIFGRGMYTRTTFTAWNFQGGTLERIWTADHAAGSEFGSRGAHSLSIADVDDDPMQEIVNGGATFDHDGTGICGVPFYGHGDAIHVTDLVPSRPGLEVFQPYEASGVPAYSMRDALTCELLWQGPDSPGEGPGRGVAADVDPTSPGAEAWVSGSSRMRGATGEAFDDKPQFDNFLVWWDGDVSREILNSNTVRQVDGEGGILTADGCSSNNGSKSTPTLSADLIGDWREEVVFRCGNTLRIYSTNEPTETRLYTLLHDPQYRVAISWQNGGYNQPPHPSFHIGADMAAPPVPDIHVR